MTRGRNLRCRGEAFAISRLHIVSGMSIMISRRRKYLIFDELRRKPNYYAMSEALRDDARVSRDEAEERLFISISCRMGNRLGGDCELRIIDHRTF